VHVLAVVREGSETREYRGAPDRIVHECDDAVLVHALVAPHLLLDSVEELRDKGLLRKSDESHPTLKRVKHSEVGPLFDVRLDLRGDILPGHVSEHDQESRAVEVRAVEEDVMRVVVLLAHRVPGVPILPHALAPVRVENLPAATLVFGKVRARTHDVARRAEVHVIPHASGHKGAFAAKTGVHGRGCGRGCGCVIPYRKNPGLTRDLVVDALVVVRAAQVVVEELGVGGAAGSVVLDGVAGEDDGRHVVLYRERMCLEAASSITLLLKNFVFHRKK